VGVEVKSDKGTCSTSRSRRFIREVYVDTLFIYRLLGYVAYSDELLMMNGKGCGRKQSWPVLNTTLTVTALVAMPYNLVFFYHVLTSCIFNCV
jgi:hypothetical protein